MPRFHQNQAPFAAERLVLAEVGAADPAACGVAAMFVGKHALHYKYFFATKMPVRVEERARCPAHHGCVLCTEFRQGQHGQTGHHALTPGCTAGVHHTAFGIGRVQVAQLDRKSVV